MSKRYVIVNKDGIVINSIIWDGESPPGDFLLDINGQRVNLDDVIFVEDFYASPTDIFINGDVYRKATPRGYSVDITKAKKLDNQGRPVKPSKPEDFSPLFAEVTKPAEAKIQQIVTEKLAEIENLNKEEGKGDAI